MLSAALVNSIFSCDLSLARRTASFTSLKRSANCKQKNALFIILSKPACCDVIEFTRNVLWCYQLSGEASNICAVKTDVLVFSQILQYIELHSLWSLKLRQS